MQEAPALRARGLSKTFGPNRVLSEVDLEIAAGSVHALLGHNGSGKSTFIKILSGLYLPDEGSRTVEVAGTQLSLGEANAAAHAGVSFVHQSLGLVPDLTVQENLRLGKAWQRGRFGNIRWRQDAAQVQEALAALDVRTRPSAYVRDLSATEQTQVAIVKALTDAEDLKLLVLDEVTAALTDAEVARLFGTVERITKRGVGVLYVTHRLEEIADLADELTVLRDGTVTARRSARGATVLELVNLISPDITGPVAATGTSSQDTPEQPGGLGEPVLELKGLIGGTIDGLDLVVRPGELVGVVGLVGSGAGDLARALSGRLRVAGRVSVGGRPADLRHTHDLRSRGVALVVGDRGHRVVQDMSVGENITLGTIWSYFRHGLLRHGDDRRAATDAVERFRIRSAGLQQQASLLSGGNRQKLAVARALLTEPKVLVLEEPFSGVDAGGRADVGQILRDATAAGMGVLVIDTDLEELVGLVDRALVMRQGRVAATFEGGELTRQNLMNAYHGGRGVVT